MGHRWNLPVFTWITTFSEIIVNLLEMDESFYFSYGFLSKTKMESFFFNSKRIGLHMYTVLFSNFIR